MTEETFLADPAVQEMLEWFVARFGRSSGWTHTYHKAGARWSCDSLADAFRQYAWNGKPWRENKAELDADRRDLREAVRRGDVDLVVKVCEAVLRWGGVSAHNVRYLHKRKPVLLNEIGHLRKVLAGDRTPSKSDLRIDSADPKDPATECRMNAGFVKIYSLLCDYCVIYDGRVGAALGLLVRQFCEATRRTTVPPSLAFAFGSPKEGPNPKSPKLRDPGCGPLRFRKLPPDSRFHTAQVMRANWFLRRALEINPQPFSTGEDGFHELAAGLFMVGYDLREARCGEESARPRRNSDARPRNDHRTTIEWDGITLAGTLTDDATGVRHALAAAARSNAWPRVFELLSEHPEWVNSTRPGGSSWYAPLHQAAWHGAPVAVVQRLIDLGAWRTHQNARGERAVDVADRRGHRHLLGALAPAYKHRVPFGVLLKVQAHFHAVIRGRAEQLVEEHGLRLPELEPLLELDKPGMWFPVPGMYGGFSYQLTSEGVQPRLVSESWCRVVGGSGERHEITSGGSQLVEQGFV